MEMKSSSAIQRVSSVHFLTWKEQCFASQCFAMKFFNTCKVVIVLYEIDPKDSSTASSPTRNIDEKRSIKKAL